MASQQDECFTSSASFLGDRSRHLSHLWGTSNADQRVLSLHGDIHAIITSGFGDVKHLETANVENAFRSRESLPGSSGECRSEPEHDSGGDGSSKTKVSYRRWF